MPHAQLRSRGDDEFGLRRVRRFSQQRRGDFQIIDEAHVFPCPGVCVRQPQQIGRMHRHQRLDPVIEIDRASAI
jgi:hypothetical protein